MRLILSLRDGRGERVGADRPLSEGTLAIGRAPGNDWVLADPDRHLSKTHCKIEIESGAAALTDLSSNGVFMNGEAERVTRNGRVILRDGDEIGLGDYTITVKLLADADPAFARLPASAAPDRASPSAGFTDPFARQGAFDRDPFAPDPLAPDPFAAPGGLPGEAGVASRRTPAGGTRPVAARDTFDLADEAGGRRDVGQHRGDLFRGVHPAEMWEGPSQPDNADGPREAFAGPRVRAPARLDDLDIDALLGDTPPGEPAAAPGEARAGAASTPRAPARRPAAPPGPPPPEMRAETRAPAVVQGVSSGDDAAAGLAAFLDGAGVAGLDCGRDPEATLRMAGQLFAIMVAGLCQTLRSRSAIKNEFRVDQTMIRPIDNNPLKFTLNEHDAIAAMLQVPRPGYLDADSSAREAFRDIGEHQLAVMAGVQTALMALLKRFEPAALEKRLDTGVLGGLVPAARKARTWELFCATYSDIVRDAEGDFRSVFGREFARAYDAQTRKPDRG